MDNSSRRRHLSRYLWAAGLTKGKRVLDAGCGTAYGTALLAEAGATSVLGVDLASSVARFGPGRDAGDGRDLRVADLTNLELPDHSFDLVVCFEVIEHFKEPLVVLDDLARVLADAASSSSPRPTGAYIHPATHITFMNSPRRSYGRRWRSGSPTST